MREAKRDRMELDGEVIDDSNGQFKVQIKEGYIVSATLSGKIRQNSIRILLGDRVTVEISEYDTAKGRIKSRLKPNKAS